MDDVELSHLETSAGTIDYVDTGGEGPTLVFVHGLVMDHTLWGTVIEGLRADHRCVAPILPLGGHRHPMHAAADLTLHGQATLLAEFIEALDLHDVVLVSSDWGGPQITAVEHPGRLAGLVLLPQEAFDNIPPGLPGKFASFLTRVPGGLAVAARTLTWPGTARMPNTFGWMVEQPIATGVLRSWATGMRSEPGVRRDVERYVRTSDMTGLIRASTRFGSFDRPVLVLWCTDDRVMPRDHGRRLAELFPAGRLVEVPDSSTLIPLDAPERVVSEIRSFVAECVPAGPVT